jgi:hypothetical protein
MNPTADIAEKLPVTPRSIDVLPSVLPTVNFSSNEIQMAMHVAAARLLSYKDSEARDTYGSQDAIEAHTTGILGEMAVRRVFDNPDEEVVYIYGDGGSDVDIRGLSADVKTTCADVFLPDLIVSAIKELEADLYILCHRLDPDRIRVVGFASQEMVTNHQPKRFPGSQLNHVVGPEILRVLRVSKTLGSMKQCTTH